MVSIKESEELAVARKLFNDTEEAYCKIFGKNSLDRVAYIDPLHPTIEGYENAALTLESAIRKNIALEQTPKEIWDRLVF
jgi:hypothetical protein